METSSGARRSRADRKPGHKNKTGQTVNQETFFRTKPSCPGRGVCLHKAGLDTTED
jgi:hypothetical protein